jgi:hypothetical protein
MEKELRSQIEAIKTSKMPEKEKARLIALAREWASKERKLQRMSKEEKLRAIYADYIGLAVDFAKSLGNMIGSGSLKETSGIMTKDLKRELRFGLTTRLKKFGVLPLGK